MYNEPLRALSQRCVLDGGQRNYEGQWASDTWICAPTREACLWLAEGSDAYIWAQWRRGTMMEFSTGAQAKQNNNSYTKLPAISYANYIIITFPIRCHKNKQVIVCRLNKITQNRVMFGKILFLTKTKALGIYWLRNNNVKLSCTKESSEAPK